MFDETLTKYAIILQTFKKLIDKGLFLSLQQELQMVKEELTSEEKFFEKAVITEKFVKKYKKHLIGAIITIVLIVAGNIAYNLNKQHTIDMANKTIAELKNKPDDVALLTKLKTLSPELYDVWTYSVALANSDTKKMQQLQNSKAILIGNLSTYEVAQASKDLQKLDSYAQKDGAIYKDLALIQSAIILMQNGKIDDAHMKLNMIRTTSPFANIVKALMHYGVK